MRFFLLLFIFIASSINAQIHFHVTDSFEKEEIHNSMTAFYTEHLIKAGLFESEEAASEAAMLENQGLLDHNGQIFYNYLTSEDGRTRYGYFVYSIEDQIAYIVAIYLDCQHQGKGLGKQVLHNFETLLLENHVHVIKLYVFDHNKRAIELYKKDGYEIETTYSIGEKLIGHHMIKII